MRLREALTQQKESLGHVSCVAMLLAFASVVSLIFSSTFASADDSSSGPSTSNELLTNQPQPRRNRDNIQVGWQLEAGGESFANEKEQMQVAGARGIVDFKYHLLSGLDFKGTGSLDLFNGYSQSQFGDNIPRTGVLLREAVIQYKPISNATLQAGAVNQGYWDIPQLVDGSQAFPGALERVIYGPKNFAVEIQAQQLIPTSTTLSTQSVDAEVTPSYMTQGLLVHTEPAKDWTLQFGGLHYSFEDLPSAVAQQSGLYGNFVNETGPKSATFIYGFDGFVGLLDTQLQLNHTFGIQAHGRYLQNSLAPETYNRGELAEGGFNIRLPGEIEVSPIGGYFYTESDVTPGFYSDSTLGQNNRVGWYARLESTFKKQGFKVITEYVNADLINPSLTQSREQVVLLKFRTLRELF